MQRHRLAAVLTALMLWLCAMPALAYVSPRQSFAAVKFSSPPPADPSLQSAVWKQALTATNFFDYTDLRPARFATTAYFGYDSKNLYVAFSCEQHGAPIVATQTVDHANMYSDDHVTVGFDTTGSGSRVYEFSVTPKGIHSEFDSENSRYAPAWQSYAKILPGGGYNVVMIIPISDLRAQNSRVQSWRINFERFVAAENDQYTWAYDPAEQSIDSSQFWPTLSGIRLASSAARPKPSVDVYGLASGGSDHNIYENGVGNFTATPTRPAGVDFTYPFTNTLALVGTINPDFSNVEEDQEIISPQEFQRNYTEYRPFFAQGANYINSLPGININSYETMFYTPGIGVFNRGLKVEGTSGRSSIGALNVTGAGFNDTAAGYNYSTSDNQLDFSYEGVQANHTGVRDDTNGIGAFTQNSHSGFLTGGRFEWERGTGVDMPGQADNWVYAAGVQNSRIQTFAIYKDIGPEYNPVDGYLQLNDIRGPQAFFQYNGHAPAGSALKTYQIFLVGDRFRDRSGATHQADTVGSGSVTFKNLLTLGYTDGVSELRLYGQGFPAYSSPQDLVFNGQSVSLGYKDGTPSPVDVSYSWGPYGIFQTNATGNMFLQQFSASTSRQFGVYGVSVEFDGAVEHALPGSQLQGDSQWLRRISLTRSFGKDASLAIGLRNINGTGGFALPGTNIAIAFHQRFANQDQLWIDYGTPAAPYTLHRLIVKYVFHAGGGTGT